MQTVNKNSPIPYYHQLAELLRSEIEQHRFDAGVLALPSENELVDRYHVSRATVRSALDLLERERLIYRQKGKGAFAAVRRVEHELTDLVSTTEEMARRGWSLETRVLSLEKIEPPAVVTQMLELPPGERVYRVERLRLAQQEPVSIQTACLPEALFPELEQQDLTSSLYRLCENVYNQRFWTGRQTLRARGATAAEARLLRIPEHTAVMCAERVSYSVQGNAVEYLEAVWRGDRYDFKVTLTRPVSV
jgi:GntR family transcriptional regulator